MRFSMKVQQISFLLVFFFSGLGFFGEGGWGDGVSVVLFVSFAKINICNLYETYWPHFVASLRSSESQHVAHFG